MPNINKNGKAKLWVYLFTLTLSVFHISVKAEGESMLGHFNPAKDLFLAQFDSKTDVDDVHSIAGVATMLAHETFRQVRYIAVAGAYGDQDGLYVPSPQLFALAFHNNYVDAHNHYDKALAEVSQKVLSTLADGGDIWVAEAGQSNFTADVLRQLKLNAKHIDTKRRFHVVQHSTWNEQSTNPNELQFVKNNADYHKIPDGNASGNGTPGFRNETMPAWQVYIQNVQLKAIWKEAFAIANTYNGKEGRYDNKAISAGGIDFSDVSETCWIFGFAHIKNESEFFKTFAQ